MAIKTWRCCWPFLVDSSVQACMGRLSSCVLILSHMHFLVIGSAPITAPPFCFPLYLFLSRSSYKYQPLQQILQFSMAATVEGTFLFNKISNKSQKLISLFPLFFFSSRLQTPLTSTMSLFSIVFSSPFLYKSVFLVHVPALPLSVSHSGAGTCSRNMMDDHLSRLVYYNSDNQLHIPNAACPAGYLHARHRPKWKWNLICQMSFRGYSMMITAWLFQQLCTADNVITYCLP